MQSEALQERVNELEVTMEDYRAQLDTQAEEMSAEMDRMRAELQEARASAPAPVAPEAAEANDSAAGRPPPDDGSGDRGGMLQLYEKKVGMSKWKPRYFHVPAGSTELKYYADQSLKQCKGTIDLSIVDVSPTQNYKASTPFVFQLVVNDKSMVTVCADDMDTMRGWLLTILERIQSVQPGESSVTVVASHPAPAPAPLIPPSPSPPTSVPSPRPPRSPTQTAA